MRRAAALIAIALVALTIAGALLRNSEGTSYEVAAVFDSAEGIQTGQLVKIAGARVGAVLRLKLLPGPRALIVFSIPRAFAPFHADASCQILPEGLISENYIECAPGTPQAPPLARQLEHLPTVPIGHTAVPVSLQDVLDIFSMPVDQRAAILINELGIGTAGRGTDIAAILRRADPALVQGDRVLAILDGQSGQIATSISQLRTVIGHLAGTQANVTAFIDRAASVTASAAGQRADLSLAVARLPSLLGWLRADLPAIDQVAQTGTPLLSDLKSAAPGLLRLTELTPPFTAVASPAVQAIAHATGPGTHSLQLAAPVISELTRFSDMSPPVLQTLDRLLVSSRDAGAIEGLLRLFYSLATDSASYDSTSHWVTGVLLPFAPCLSNPQTLGCSHAYNAPDEGEIPVNDAITSSAADRSHHLTTAPRATTPAARDSQHASRASPGTATAPGPTPGSSSPSTSTTPSGPSAPSAPSTLRSLLGYLLR